ncbi:MAG TPA: hypothetical protein PKY96_13805, partial [Flavobacteriales bacterium]|nr:hypothetical protein [Flavobacteriales bacterium]
MLDHIRSIRNWHYVLVLLAIAGLAMSVDLSNSNRSRKALLTYLSLEVQQEAFTGLRLYQDSIDAAVARHCGADTACYGRAWVQRFMEELYRFDLNVGLDADEDLERNKLLKTTLPPKDWMTDQGYTNELLLQYAQRMQNIFLMGSPVVQDLADSLFKRLQNRDPRFKDMDPFMLTKHVHKSTWGPEGIARLIKPGLQLFPDSFYVRAARTGDDPISFLHDTIWVRNISGERVSLSSALNDLRQLHIWKDVKDKCYSEGAALVRDRIEQDAINLPVVGLAIRKRSAILLLMAACLLIGLLMHLNLLGANRLFTTPLQVPDLEAAYTSAYIGTNATPLALAINYALLLLMPTLAFVLLAWYSVAVTPAWQLIGMLVLIIAYVIVAWKNVRLMNDLANRAERHWRAS